MSRNGSGVYNLVTNSWFPPVAGVAATPTDWQTFIEDVASAITQSVSADGQTPITGNLNMGGNRLTSLAAGVATGQSVRWEQLFDQGTEADIASAATVDIGAQNTNFLRVTGTTTITSFGTTYRGPRFVRFAGILTLTHNASTLILPTSANIVTAAGDRAIIVPKATAGTADGWQVVAYQRANGGALAVDLAGATGTLAIANGGTGSTTGATAIAALFGTRADVASAATVDLSSAVSSINITGTTTITAFTIAVGRVILVRFNASLTLTNNANIVTQTGGNIVTQAGDTCILRATSANVVEVLSYTPAVLNQQTTRSMVTTQTSNGVGSTNTAIRRFTTIATNVGTDITYADSATLGGSFTINSAGVYAISYTDAAAAATNMGISLNSANLSTSVGAIPASERLTIALCDVGTAYRAVSWTGYLASGSVIRAHVNVSAGNAGTNTTAFTIVRLA